MAQIDANVPKSGITDSLAFYLQNTTKQDRYRLWTNSKTVSYNFGSSIGIGYELPKGYRISGNFTYAKLDRKSQNDGLEDGFNTPEWGYNFSFGNPGVYKIIGFNINYRQQASYLWQSALATGNVPSYSTLDAQVNASFLKNALQIKLGASNLMNRYYYSFIGGPQIGGFYYVGITYNLDRTQGN
jgi:iron complex outermembrane receptor protein